MLIKKTSLQMELEGKKRRKTVHRACNYCWRETVGALFSECDEADVDERLVKSILILWVKLDFQSAGDQSAARPGPAKTM